MPYDLLIKGGHVLDPGRGLDGAMDIGITGTNITAVVPDIDRTEALRVIEVKGDNRYVTPGLIDIHTHVALGAATAGAGMASCNPDQIGVRSGVTTVVDCGSVGIANMGAMRHYVIPNARTRIVPFVNVGSHALTMPGPDVGTLEDVDPKTIASVIEANPGLIKGFKLRMIGPVAQHQGVELVKVCKAVSREHHLPLMVHIGDGRASDYNKASAATRFLLESFDPGDILTHLVTPHPGGVMEDESRMQPMPELQEARNRGVVLDPALGANNFSFDLCRHQADIGLYPDTISSDLTAFGRGRVVYSLMECMGRFMAAGYSVSDMVRMSTTNAAKALGLQNEIGAIKAGMEADITVLDVVNGKWSFVDTVQKQFSGDKAMKPVVTIKAGEVFELEWGPHPWGWLPPEA